MCKELQQASAQIKNTLAEQGRNVEIETIDGALCVVDDSTDEVLFIINGSTKQAALYSFAAWCHEYYQMNGFIPF